MPTVTPWSSPSDSWLLCKSLVLDSQAILPYHCSPCSYPGTCGWATFLDWNPSATAPNNRNSTMTLQIFSNHPVDIPIPSMYGIFTCICLICMVNAGKYTIHGCYGICKYRKNTFYHMANIRRCSIFVAGFRKRMKQRRFQHSENPPNKPPVVYEKSVRERNRILKNQNKTQLCVQTCLESVGLFLFVIIILKINNTDCITVKPQTNTGGNHLPWKTSCQESREPVQPTST